MRTIEEIVAEIKTYNIHGMCELEPYVKNRLDEILEIHKAEQSKWIPVSERLPRDLEPVNITWINHNPENYYENIKDKPYTATALRANCRWYWWSTRCVDILKEYGRDELNEVDYGIEIIAWMPLPEPYKAESEGKE